MYVPTIARFSSVDPLLLPPDGEPVLLGKIPDGLATSAPLNPYSYASNNPATLLDPSGQVAILAFKKEPKCAFSKCDDKDTKSTFTLKKDKTCTRPLRLIFGKHFNDKKKKIEEGYYCIECKTATCFRECRCNPDVVENKKTGAVDPVCNCVLPKDAW